MQAKFTIGRLAKTADVPISTLRYYEQRGLLHPEQRSGSNYRLYGRESLDRLRFIRIAQRHGFTLEDIALLLGIRDGSSAECCDQVEVLVGNRLDHVVEQLRELQRVQKVLKGTLDWCRNPKEDGRCRVLDDLDAQSKQSSA